VAGADVAVVVVGGKSGLTRDATVGEARDATDLGLPGGQQAFVDAVIDTGVPTVVVLLSGRVHAIPSIAERAAAVVQAWLPGEEGGNGLADVLFGAVDARGRLPVSMPRNVGQVPVHHDVRFGGGRAQFYGDYTDSPADPLFAFGHGLSYTTFGYGDLRAGAGATDMPVHLSVTVTNTGPRAGHEVVQLYARDEVASVARPMQQLVGFAGIDLDAGEAATIEFTVDPSRLAFYDPAMRFVMEPGDVTFMVGASSAEIRSRVTVRLGGPVTEYRQRDVVATAIMVT
jgi:beta-glucosidase